MARSCRENSLHRSSKSCDFPQSVIWNNSRLSFTAHCANHNEFEQLSNQSIVSLSSLSHHHQDDDDSSQHHQVVMLITMMIDDADYKYK